MPYNTNREAAKIYVLSSSKRNRYECFAGEKILPPEQNKAIKQATFPDKKPGTAKSYFSIFFECYCSS